MSELARKLFDGLRAVKDGVQAVAPDLGEIATQEKGKVSRLGTQGSMELASALFNGGGFVPYGPGQYTPTPTPSSEQEHARQGQSIER